LLTVLTSKLVQAFLKTSITSILEEAKTPMVISSIGAMPQYLVQAIEQGKSVIQFVTDCRDDVALERLIHQKLMILKSINPYFEPDSNFANECMIELETYKTEVKPKLYDFIVEQGDGVISPDSYVLDTSELDADHIIGSVLSKLSDIYM
jgi:hypothetical protein